MHSKSSYEELEKKIEEIEVKLIEYKRKDDELKTIGERLANAQRIGHIGYWDLDLNKNILFWSDEVKRIFGYHKKRITPSLKLISKLIHPDDKGIVDRAYEDAKYRSKPYDIEYRLLFPSGEVRYVRSLCKIEVDEEGKAVRIHGTTQDITGYKRAEEALRESEERYRTLFNSSPNLILILQNERYLLCNPAGAKIFGFSNPKEMEGLTALERVAPESKQIVMERMDRIDLGLMNKPIEIEIMRRDWGRVFIETTSVPIKLDGKPAALIIGRDVTERKRVIEDLMNERDRAQMYLDIAGVVFVALNKKGEVTLINKKGTEILGYTEEEVIGKSWFDHFLVKDDREKVKGIFKKLMEGEITDLEYYENPILTKNGDVKMIAWRNTLLRDEKGEVVGTFSSGEDVTERKLAEEGKERLEIQLRHAQKMEAIGTLAGGIAHDFNNILGIIIGNADLALMDIPLGDSIHHNLEEIHRACIRARDLVRQILAFSRQSKQEMKPLKIGPIIKESLKFLRSSIPTTIEIKQDIAGERDTVNADLTQINQILLNLCTNAAHAMREKGGVLKVGLEDVVFRKKKITPYNELMPGEYVKLTVSDTGHGIKTELLNRIFDPYFTTKEVGQGTGMGLAVVHGIVENHKGAILVSSKLERGTTFTVLLPLARGEADSELETPGTIPGGHERVLLVDDEKAITEAIQFTLERLGYSVISKNSGVEALEAFSETPESFDLIITDMTMPKMTGLDLARQSMEIRSDIPIILCTGYSDMVDEVKAKEIGIRAFVMKPLVISEIALKIREILGKTA